MALCCPPRHGCNCPERDEPCILELCRQAMDEERAALAVRRWETLQGTPSRTRDERRFRARAYERARDRALPVLLMRAQLASTSGGPTPLPGPGPTEWPQSVQITHTMTRLDVLLRRSRRRSRR
jgi:hypothetical protein